MIVKLLQVIPSIAERREDVDPMFDNGYLKQNGRIRKRKWAQKTDMISDDGPNGPAGEKENAMTTIKIKGMTCRHCVMAVAKALGGIDGIRDVKVDLEKGEASFAEDHPVDRASIRERIAKAGFELAD